jgi:wyosine [tRNA(Phe)-imidazoG37] synthetase (radical SAM superfamily)
MDLESQIVYGPIWTRRFGWDIGVNLLPLTHKLCTFDCIYCQYGPLTSTGKSRFPSITEVMTELSSKWESCINTTSENLHITIAGNGEPTMYPQFTELVEKLTEWRDQVAPDLRLALLSNGYRIHKSEIRKAMNLLDEPIVKLDCAISEKITSVNQPVFSFDLDEFIEDLKKCDHIIIQTMFVKGYNDGVDDLRYWMEALKRIQPSEVQIYTISRTPPNPISAITNRELQSIANVTSTVVGIPVHAYFS